MPMRPAKKRMTNPRHDRSHCENWAIFPNRALNRAENRYKHAETSSHASEKQAWTSRAKSKLRHRHRREFVVDIFQRETLAIKQSLK